VISKWKMEIVRRVGKPKKRNKATKRGGDGSPARDFKQKSGLESLNVGSLQTLGAADHLKLNGLTLVERAIAVRLNRGEMDENVLASLALDETIALAGIEPLHCTLFFH